MDMPQILRAFRKLAGLWPANFFGFWEIPRELRSAN